MSRLRHAIRYLAAASCLPLITACPGPPVTRDTDDTSPPELSLTVTAAKDVDSGLSTVSFGTDVELVMPGGSLLVKAEDPGGVSVVELWMTTTVTCPVGDDLVEQQGPGIATAPVARAEGEVTDTQAPSSLTVSFDINTLELQAGCTYAFDVWGTAANAATTPASTTSPASTLTLRS